MTIENFVPDDLASLDIVGLREELKRSLAMTAAALTRMAIIIRLLEEKGEDLSDIRLGLFAFLRRVAYGQMLPEVIVRFGQNPSLMRRVASLPLPDQARLVEGEPVAMVVARDGGMFTTRMSDPGRMLPDQIRQVFGPAGLRDEQEQILFLEDRGLSPRSDAGTVRLVLDLTPAQMSRLTRAARAAHRKTEGFALRLIEDALGG